MPVQFLQEKLAELEIDDKMAVDHIEPEPEKKPSQITLSDIPQHEALKVKGDNLGIDLDCVGNYNYFYSNGFKEYCSTLLSTLEAYRNLIKNVYILVLFPGPKEHHMTIRSIQSKLIDQIVGKLNDFSYLEYVEVTVKGPMILWPHISTVVGFHSLRLENWRMLIEDGDAPIKVLGKEATWVRRLAGLSRASDRPAQA